MSNWKFLTFLFFLIATQASYNVTRSIKLMYMAEVTYQNISDIKTWTCPRCLVYPDTINVTTFKTSNELFGFAAYSPIDQAILVSFRGTVNDTSNFLTDLSLALISYPYCKKCKVYSGAYSGFLKLKGKVSSAVSALIKQYPKAKIFLSGHSIGGSLAQFTALYIKNTYKITPQVYTYGLPRTGNSQYATYYQNSIVQSYQIVHHRDIIPHNPSQLLGYRHSNTEVWYDKNMNNFKLCKAQSTRCSQGVSTLDLSISDHQVIGGYINIVNSALTASD